MRLVRHVARIWEKKGACRLLVGKPVAKRPLGRPRLRWEVLQDIGRGKWSGVI
jgi:hypothetical protein